MVGSPMMRAKIDVDLTGDGRCAAAAAFLTDLQHVATLVGPEGFQAPVVEDEHPPLNSSSLSLRS
jgi:hypothetical protein